MSSKSLLIFVEEISERLIYTLDFVFNERGMQYELTNDYLYFSSADGYKFNYSNRFIQDVLQLIPSRVLFDEEYLEYDLTFDPFNSEPCIGFDGVVDPLASVFFQLVRYEEYTPLQRDEHNRFTATMSLAYKQGWLEKAMCDRWSFALIDWLTQSIGIPYSKEKNVLKVIPGFDIDNTYAYLLKEGWRTMASNVKDFLQRNNESRVKRKKVLSGQEDDPYDTYDYLLSLESRGIHFFMFWLLGDFSRYDKNISHLDPRHQRLIRSMDLHAEIGIHPSYRSTLNATLVKEEKNRIEQILDHPILHARQHFLKVELPTTYRNYLNAGIAHDHSMGFADHIGFRCGTARPHYWFDVLNNKCTSLWIHPFVYMDGTLNEYMKLTPEVSMPRILELINEVRSMGGNFECIWHNETLTDNRHWSGWRNVLEYTLSLSD